MGLDRRDVSEHRMFHHAFLTDIDNLEARRAAVRFPKPPEERGDLESLLFRVPGTGLLHQPPHQTAQENLNRTFAQCPGQRHPQRQI